MSEVFIILIENNIIYFGQVHWRKLLKPDIRKHLNQTEFDGGLIFYDKDDDFFLDLQDCVTLKKPEDIF